MSGHWNDHPSRAVPPLPVERARRKLALDLSLVNLLEGPDLMKAGTMQFLPLMEVALNGHYGVVVAERKARKAA